MVLQLLKYNITVIYKPGKYLCIAVLTELNKNFDSDIEYVIHSLINCLPVSDSKKLEIKEITRKILNFI